MSDARTRICQRFTLCRAIGCMGLAGAACMTTGGGSPAPNDAGPVVAPAPVRPTSWQDVNVTTTANGPAAAGLPMGYVRHDAVPAIVYRAATKTRGKDTIFEFSDREGSWQKLDLCATVAGGCNPTAGLFGYARADGSSSVFYTSRVGNENHVKDIAWDNAAKIWRESDMTLAGKGTAAYGSPAAYVRSDKANALVYCRPNGEIREIASTSSGWRDTSLTQTAAGAEPANCDLCQPYPLTTSDSQSLVFYLGLDSHVHALHLKGTAWTHYDLTVEGGAKDNAHPCPTAYQRADNVISVLFKVPANGGFKLHEITGIRNATGWSWGDWDFFKVVSPTPPLMQACQGTLCNPGDAYGYVTPRDSTTHIVYPSINSTIEEITLKAGKWTLSVPSPSSAGCAEPAFFPRPYVRKDGSAAVVYLDPGAAVHELRGQASR
jgi:hypothetical protein